MAKKKTCYACGGTNPFAADAQMIELTQQGKNRFTVRYGAQVTSGLTYERAAEELGASIMHMAACNGDLDNG